MTNNIEEKIREYYLSEDGEWLVEKGKVKEARLLKEAVERITTLRRWRYQEGIENERLRSKILEFEDKDYMTLEQAKEELRVELEEPLSKIFDAEDKINQILKAKSEGSR